MNQEDTLAKMAESRRDLLRATQGLSEEEMTQVQVEGVWTIKDVLGHIASWEEICLVPLRRYADGGPFSAEAVVDYSNLNKDLAARKQDIPLEAIVDELQAVRKELVVAAGKLSAGRWKQSVLFPWGDEGPAADLLDELCEHEMEHVHAIQQWREDRG